MSPIQCTECGLVIGDGTGTQRCYALKRKISKKELSEHWLCDYYLPVIFEDNKPLTPFQHFLIKQDEIDRKK